MDSSACKIFQKSMINGYELLAHPVMESDIMRFCYIRLMFILLIWNLKPCGRMPTSLSFSDQIFTQYFLLIS